MRVHRDYRAGVAEMASALLLLLAVLAAARQLVSPADGEPPNETAPPATATIAVDYEKSALSSSGNAARDLQFAAPDAESVPWRGWVWLDGKRLEAACDDDRVRAVASRIMGGVAVAIFNPEPTPALLRLNVRLPAGRYTIERLVFDAQGSRIERLQSAALSAPGSVLKPGYLLPATGAVYRVVNNAEIAAAAYRRAMQQARNFRAISASQSVSMATALRECPWMLSQAQKSLSSEDAIGALRPIHRALLGVRHAQAICGNTRASGPAARRLLDRLAIELDALENALGECSVAALGLVPSATAEAADGRVRVEVRVRNAGAHTISAVKLWLTGPSGCSVEPELQAVFDTLRPGQAAMAEFTASCGAAASNGDTPAIAASDLWGHLSYIRDQAPAHVRIAVR